MATSSSFVSPDGSPFSSVQEGIKSNICSVSKASYQCQYDEFGSEISTSVNDEGICEYKDLHGTRAKSSVHSDENQIIGWQNFLWLVGYLRIHEEYPYEIVEVLGRFECYLFLYLMISRTLIF